MGNLVIVAIPDENDRVWKVSSEKIPHLTVLNLGDVDQVSNLDQIMQFVEHAASVTLRRFYLSVDRRDELGDDKADVLFFRRNPWDFKTVRDFRVQLLKDPNIRTAYDSTEQFEGAWKPHLTLGYPDNPAKPDDTDRDYGFYDVGFNKIAIWTGEYEGPEFLLKDFWEDWDTLESDPMAAIPSADVAMSDISDKGSEFILEHYGVKGMRWGVHKNETRKGWLDPEGQSYSGDRIKVAAGIIAPPLAILTVPAQIRLGRAAGRHFQTVRTEKKDAEFEQTAQSQKNFVKIHNAAIAKANDTIVAANKKYAGKDLTKDPKAKKQYDDEVMKGMRDAYQQAANSITNKSGTRSLDVEFKSGDQFVIRTKKVVKHAATDEDDLDFEVTGKIQRHPTGHIRGFVFDGLSEEKDEMAQAAEDGAEFLMHTGLMSPEQFLEHYGVRGMRWGVRRSDSGAPSAVDAVATSRVPAGDKRKTKIDVEGGQNHEAAPEAIKVAQSVAKLKKSGVHALSNQELREVAQRKQLEQQVKQLTSPAGQKFVTNLLRNQGTQLANQTVQTQVKKQFSK